MAEKKYYPNISVPDIVIPNINPKLVGSDYHNSTYKIFANSLIKNFNSGKKLKESIDEFVLFEMKDSIIIEELNNIKNFVDEKKTYLKIHNSIDINEIGLTYPQIKKIKNDVISIAKYARDELKRQDVFDYVNNDLEKVMESYI